MTGFYVRGTLTVKELKMFHVNVSKYSVICRFVQINYTNFKGKVHTVFNNRFKGTSNVVKRLFSFYLQETHVGPMPLLLILSIFKKIFLVFNKLDYNAN